MSTSAPLEQALKDSLTSGRFVDTKFWVFSKRDSSGQVSNPRPLYANSRVLKRVRHFEILLSEGFEEGIKKDLTEDFPEHQNSYRDDYEYLADSDLEDDVDDSSTDRPAGTGEPGTVDLTPRPPVPTPEGLGGEQDIAIDDLKKIQLYSELDHPGNVVVIQDAAFTTFKCLLLFLYTGQIEFNPIGPSNKRSYNPQFGTDTRPKASPKSIYRLADKYDIPELKKIAFDHICTEGTITESDIVDETFSGFSSSHDDIRIVEVGLLARAMVLNPKTFLSESLRDTVQRYAKGEMPGSSETLVAFFDVLSSGKLPERPQPVEATRTQIPPSLKTALINSLTTGIFLDLKFHVSTFGSESGAEAVYFSQIVAGGCINKIESLGAPECDYDSDLEDDCAQIEGRCADASPASHVVSDDNLLSESKSLTPNRVEYGALRTWLALLFYMYTSEVSFAPLSTQGVEKRKATIEEQLSLFPHKPRLCSPKSLYSLAHKLGLSSLKDLALKSLESKLDASNILEELFSEFTSYQQGILAKEIIVLSDKMQNNQELTSEIRERIKAMAEGHAPHGSAALISILFLLVKKMPRPSVQAVYPRAPESYFSGKKSKRY